MLVSCANNSLNNNSHDEDKTNDTLTDNNKNDNISNGEDEMNITAIYLYVNENKLTVTLADNVSVKALVGLLQKGDITYTASDYGGFEKVGALGQSLPTANSQITTKVGDVVLYSGNQIVFFYGSNTWSYTRIGKINGYSDSELRSLLGEGQKSVQVKLSLK